MDRYQYTGIIPARYASSRFPGKPLVQIGDKTMIRRVYEQVSRSVDTVFVATDDRRIYDEIIKFGGKVIITSPDHRTGTDRCAEAVEKIMAETGKKIDIVLNIQGDEPFIRPEQIDLLKSCFEDSNVDIATLIREFIPGENIFNPNHPKAILDSKGNAIYFSRSAIPYIRDAEPDKWIHQHVYYKHLGLYAYRTEVLRKITKIPQSPLETAESLEQNRWIENGFKIRAAVTKWESICIDTPEDLKQALEHLENFS